MNWLKHAFAIDSPAEIKPNDSQSALVEKVCREVVRRRLTVPALFTLEMSRPLNYVSAQFLHFLEPIVTVLVNKSEYRNLTTFLEQRGSIEYVCGRIDALEAEYESRESNSSSKPATRKASPQSREPHAQD